MTVAALYDAGFNVFASDATYIVAGGGANYAVRCFIRGTTPDELIAAYDQATGLATLSRADLDQHGIEPAKFDRIKTADGHQYTVEGVREGNFSDDRICVKCWVKG